MSAISNKNRQELFFILMIVFLSCASFVRVWSMHGTMWDDNAWLMSIYASHGLVEFLNTSFIEMRRVPLGIFLYPLFWLHKNSDLYYVAWHSLNTVTQIGSPLLLYATCSRLFGNKLLAFLIAATLAVLYLDQTLAYASAINYRIGLLLAILSFYFTVRAIQGNRPFLFLGLSLISAVIAYTVFMEAVIALEPGRFAVIFYMLNSQTKEKKSNLFRTAFLKWLPFIVVSIPFAIYKLMYRSYGIYAGVYEPDFLFLLDVWRILDLLAFIFLFQWVIFADHIASVSWWSIGVAIASVIVLLSFFKHQSSLIFSDRRKSPSWQTDKMLAKYALYIGLILLIFPLMFFQFFRRPVTWGISSSHGAIPQFGYAMVLGSILFMLFNRAAKKSLARLRVFFGGVALFFSLAIFFNNLNLDLYQESHQQQSTFWKRFVVRLPSLPANAIFLFDIKDRSLYGPMYYYYYEFMVNLLYAENSVPEEFRRYRATTFFELYWQNKIKDGEQLRGLTFTRESLWGKDQVDPSKFTWVFYDGNDLLINNEILKKYPDSPYRLYLNIPVPVASGHSKTYPFRYKVLGDN